MQIYYPKSVNTIQVENYRESKTTATYLSIASLEYPLHENVNVVLEAFLQIKRRIFLAF
jgi:hypothetical protein